MSPFTSPASTHPRGFRRLRKDDSGLTLVELLIVITILGILAGIVFFSARNLRGEATAAATGTDAGIVRTAEEAYCANTAVANTPPGGTYATRLSQMRTPPNDVLTAQSVLNGAVPWTPTTTILPPYSLGNPAYTAYQAGGAGAGTGATTPCGGQSFVVGPLPITSGSPISGGGPEVLTDARVAAPLSFLSASFQQLFGGIYFSPGATSATVAGLAASPTGVDDWLWVSSTGVAPGTPPALPVSCVLATGLSPTLNTPCLKTLTIRQYATGVLDLMACRAGGLSVPITASCLPPVTDASDTASQFRSNATATTTSTVPLTAPTFTMAQLGAELAAATTAGACSGGANALLAIENPATSPFGIAAEAALLAPIASGGANLGSLAPYLLPAGNGCIVFGGFGPGQATAQQILRGTPVAGVAAAQHAKYALLSQAATMDPTATETNWTLKVPVSAYSSSAAGVIPMYMAILSPPISANPNYEAQARRFMNYMLSPLGQAVLAEYGFGPITPQATDITGTGGTVLPVPENSTL